ncbi:MAG: hypothetical protein AB2A00_26565, partial [Myxococcota bacterium]
MPHECLSVPVCSMSTDCDGLAGDGNMDWYGGMPFNRCGPIRYNSSDGKLYTRLESPDAGDRILVIIMQADLGVDENAAMLNETNMAGVGRWWVTRVISSTLVNTESRLEVTEPITETQLFMGARAQFCTVPEYGALTLYDDITPAQAWDGERGGVVAVMAESIYLNGHDIHADAAGFRGGQGGSPNVACGEPQNPGEGITTYPPAPVPSTSAETLGGGGGTYGNGGGGGGGHGTPGGAGGEAQCGPGITSEGGVFASPADERL